MVRSCTKLGFEIQRQVSWCPYFEIVEGKEAPLHSGLCWMCSNCEEKEEENDSKK
jgi:hypothetical protein